MKRGSIPNRKLRTNSDNTVYGDTDQDNDLYCGLHWVYTSASIQFVRPSKSRRSFHNSRSSTTLLHSRKIVSIEIDYPGSNNYTRVSYDAAGRRGGILEVQGGSTTSTKQFIYCGFTQCEERDASGTLTKQFFVHGQRNGSTNYFYSQNHLGSVIELTDNSGAIVTQLSYDPYGRKTIVNGSLEPDIEYAAYYNHARSGQSFTVFREYNSTLGNWLNRDPIGEGGGNNLYAYVNGATMFQTDIMGLSALGDSIWSEGLRAAKSGHWTRGRAECNLLVNAALVNAGALPDAKRDIAKISQDLLKSGSFSVAWQSAGGASATTFRNQYIPQTGDIVIWNRRVTHGAILNASGSGGELLYAGASSAKYCCPPQNYSRAPFNVFLDASNYGPPEIIFRAN